MSEKVTRFQELAHSAWSAKDNILFKGWILRLSEGVTRRANSVLTIRYLGDNVVADIKSVETLYESRKLPTVFQIADYHEPDNIIEKLLSLGYKEEAETTVMSRTLTNYELIEINTEIEYLTELSISDYWFEILGVLSSNSKERIEGIRNIISRNTLGKIVCFAKDNQDIVGTVLGIIENNTIGIYNLIVDIKRRREGIGRNIMIKIMNWAKENRIENIYLAVEKENIAALKLYQSLDFLKQFNYRYYVKQ